MISLIAVLKAKPGQTDALRQALQALLLPTRQEPGNLDYALFQLRDAPDTFYMREAWQGQDALDAHVAMPYFQAFMTQMESLLAEPLRLDYLTAIEPYQVRFTRGGKITPLRRTGLKVGGKRVSDGPQHTAMDRNIVAFTQLRQNRHNAATRQVGTALNKAQDVDLATICLRIVRQLC